MDLTDEESTFLAEHGLSEGDLFDGRRFYKWAWQEKAREQGKTLILGTRCRRAGRRLRTRAGHCAQCDTSKLAYQARHREDGAVYVAWSLSANLTKVGGTTDVDQRMASLTSQRYGGADDWTLQRAFTVQEYGQIERLAQVRLVEHSARREYEKGYATQVATELFDCSPDEAIAAVEEAIRDAKRSSG